MTNSLISLNAAIRAAASAVGKKEAEGPLASYLDKSYEDPLAGEKSFEKAESMLCKSALNTALSKASLT